MGTLNVTADTRSASPLIVGELPWSTLKIVIKQGEGAMTRGTLVVNDEQPGADGDVNAPNHKYKRHTTAGGANAMVIRAAILIHDTPAATAADIEAEAYVSGEFNENWIFERLTNSATATADEKAQLKALLPPIGIVLKPTFYP